jgi:hypothetical protein
MLLYCRYRKIRINIRLFKAEEKCEVINTDLILPFVSECEPQMKDHVSEQDVQASKDTVHDSCQRNLQERLDKHRTSLSGTLFY